MGELRFTAEERVILTDFARAENDAIEAWEAARIAYAARSTDRSRLVSKATTAEKGVRAAAAAVRVVMTAAQAREAEVE